LRRLWQILDVQETTIGKADLLETHLAVEEILVAVTLTEDPDRIPAILGLDETQITDETQEVLGSDEILAVQDLDEILVVLDLEEILMVEKISVEILKETMITGEIFNQLK